MSSFGRRLLEERLRLGLSQESFAEVGGVKRSSQHLYEKDVRHPDAAYLAKIHAAGADLGYLFTGRPSRQHDGQPVVSIAQALVAYRAVDAFARKHGEAASQQERERLFEFLCSGMPVETEGTSDLRELAKLSRAG
jgi:transcriptional regulator with XRE-family HTH domain